jgi:signal transduction histidine kinase
LIFSLFLFGMVLFRPTISREVIILFIGVIILSVLISKHTWWARYGPQLWWLPIIAVAAGFLSGWRPVRWTAYLITAILLINAVLVGVAHFRWEREATRTTYEQMALLRQNGEVDVDFQYFREPFGERLRAAGVTFRAVRVLQCDNPMELMSVAPGYPGAVRVCIQKK